MPCRWMWAVSEGSWALHLAMTSIPRDPIWFEERSRSVRWGTRGAEAAHAALSRRISVEAPTSSMALCRR